MLVDFDKHLSASLTRTSIGIILSVGILLSGLQLFFEYRDQHQQVEQRISELNALTQSAIKRAIHDADSEYAQEVVQSLSQYKLFHHISIFDKHDRALAIYDAALISTNTSWLTHLVKGISNDYIFSVVEPNGEAIGQIVFKLNNDEVLTPIYHHCLEVFLVGLIRNTLIGFLLIYIFHKKLTLPLREFTNSLTNYQFDQKNKNRLNAFKHHEKNELGKILTATNRLIENIEQREYDLEQNDKQLRIILNASPNLVFVLDENMHFSFLNTGTAKFYRNTIKDLIGKSFLSIHSLIDEEKANEVLNHVKAALNSKSASYSCEITLHDAEDAYHVLHTSFTPYKAADKKYILISASDITEKVDAENRLARLAYFDTLTQLPNKIQIQQKLQQDINTCRQKNSYGALFFIDIDEFKRINDTLGHSTGDALLLKLSNRMQTQIRNTETLARLGGDEFILSVPDVSDNKDTATLRASALAERLLKSIRQAVHLGEHELEVSASIGIALYPHDNYTLEKLLSAADTAMHQAKRQGKDRYLVFRTQMSEEANRLVALESDIRKGISENQFRFYLQPQLDSNTRELIGAEALLRWDHPERGQILPSKFINYLEGSPMISKVGELMLHQVCAFIYSCRNRDLMTNDLRIAINISAREFYQPNFINLVADCLETYHLHGSNLEFEITEGAALMHLDQTIATMHSLKELGIHFALDDFGTGYSSLSYLKQLPIDKIKIDKSFIKDLIYDHQDGMLVASIIAIAETQNLQVVAEGVETEDQAAWLSFQGKVAFQGFLVDRPMPAKEFEKNYFQKNPTMALPIR